MIDIMKILAGAAVGWYLGGLLFDLWRKHEQRKERKRLEKLRDAMSKSATDAFTSTYHRVYQQALGAYVGAQQQQSYGPYYQGGLGTTINAADELSRLRRFMQDHQPIQQAPIETTFEVLKSEPRLLTEGEPNGDKPVQ